MNDPIREQLAMGFKASCTLAQTMDSIDVDLDTFGNTAVTEIRLEVHHMTRRLRNLALLFGVEPAAVERIEAMHK